MKIGFAMIYPFRSSSHNMIYLKKLLEKEGHEFFYLSCDAAVPYCYNRMIKGKSKLIECSKCIVGGIRSFGVKPVTGMKSNITKNLPKEYLESIVESTGFSLHRVETDEDCKDPEVLMTIQKLYESADIVYANAEKWIDDNSLDLVILFNGRLDLTSAILHVCKDRKIPFLTFEAAYPGIALTVGEDCRGLKSLNNLVKEYKEKALNEDQVMFSGKIAAQMLLKKNIVWRLYNVNPKKVHWTKETKGKKVLIVPSSNHEFKGLEDWTSKWGNMELALDTVIENLGVNYEQCIVRCHPNWSDKIGINKTGYRSERFYTDWAMKRNVEIINSSDKANTIDLIKEADVIIVQGGTAGIEAGILGKRVVGLIPSWYSEAGFSIQIHQPEEIDKLNLLESLDSNEITRKTLRFLYTYHKRFAQMTEFVKPKNIHENTYYEGADLKNLFEALNKGFIQADNEKFAKSTVFENEIIDLIRTEQFDKLLNYNEEIINKKEIKVNRVRGLRWMDSFRSHFKSGDA